MGMGTRYGEEGEAKSVRARGEARRELESSELIAVVYTAARLKQMQLRGSSQRASASSHHPALPKSRQLNKLTSVLVTVGHTKSTKLIAYGAAIHRPSLHLDPCEPRRCEWMSSATRFRRRRFLRASCQRVCWK